MPHVCHTERARRGAGEAGCGMAIAAMASYWVARLIKIKTPRSLGSRPPYQGVKTNQPATCLMRAIISSTAFSTGHFSAATRFIAFAQTFSLLRMVNL